jgi:hypothetical protein
MLLLADPNLSERGLILAAKLATRELGPSVIATEEGLWSPEALETDGEFLRFALALREGLNGKPEVS